jgi:hypothetical protein
MVWTLFAWALLAIYALEERHIESTDSSEKLFRWGTDQLSPMID